MKVEPTSMAERLRVSGELQPINRVVLTAKAAGTITEVNALVGQPVRAGDVLVRFDTEELTAAVAQHTSNLDGARAELLLAEQTLAKAEKLSQRGIVSRATLEKALSEVLAARANVQGLSARIDIAQSALRNAEIKAPFDGIIANRAVEPGAAAAANAELMTIVDTSVLEAQVLVATRDITRLEIDQIAELHIDGLEGQVVTGTVDRINPVANEGSRFVPVYVRLENPEGRLWGGMFATGSILVRESRDILVLPATSLREDDQGEFVLKLDGGKLVRQAVAVASRWNGGTSVEVAGVSVGDVIVTSPLPEFRPGATVVVAQAG
jgi:RND family efflux transporter MFP subunit